MDNTCLSVRRGHTYWLKILDLGCLGLQSTTVTTSAHWATALEQTFTSTCFLWRGILIILYLFFPFCMPTLRSFRPQERQWIRPASMEWKCAQRQLPRRWPWPAMAAILLAHRAMPNSAPRRNSVTFPQSSNLAMCSKKSPLKPSLCLVQTNKASRLQ